MTNKLTNLSLIQEVEIQKVLKKAISANRALVNLNGVASMVRIF